MKAQAKELIDTIIVGISMVFLLIFLTYLYGEESGKVKTATEKYLLDETAFSTSLSIYGSQIPGVKKIVMESLIDAALQGKYYQELKLKEKNPKKVFYGQGLGRVNNTEILHPMLDSYFGNRWKIVVDVKRNRVEYGYNFSKNDVIVVISLPIPVPAEETGEVILLIGKP